MGQGKQVLHLFKPIAIIIQMDNQLHQLPLITLPTSLNSKFQQLNQLMTSATTTTTDNTIMYYNKLG